MLPRLSRLGLNQSNACAAFATTEQERRSQFESRLHAAADAYIVQRDDGKTIIAGYPWFTDWGRDTLIALRGLCLATGRLDVARDILLAWSSTVSQGMLPNRFPDQGGQPEFNAVDASLWFIIAVHEFLEAAGQIAFHSTVTARNCWPLSTPFSTATVKAHASAFALTRMDFSLPENAASN